MYNCWKPLIKIIFLIFELKYIDLYITKEKGNKFLKYQLKLFNSMENISTAPKSTLQWIYLLRNQSIFQMMEITNLKVILHSISYFSCWTLTGCKSCNENAPGHWPMQGWQQDCLYLCMFCWYIRQQRKMIKKTGLLSQTVWIANKLWHITRVWSKLISLPVSQLLSVKWGNTVPRPS